MIKSKTRAHMNKKYQLLALALTLTTLWACQSLKNTTVYVVPNPLEVYGDSIKYMVNVHVPPNSRIKKDMVYYAQPDLGGYKFPEVEVDLNYYPFANEQGIIDSFRITGPFIESEMMHQWLDVEQSYSRGNKDHDLPDMDNLAECCITTSRLFMANAN